MLTTPNVAKAARKRAGVVGRKASKAWYKEHRADWKNA